jgi:aspartyl-tRNA(Asn)/glutamyl-tRNA(Gln) amidotransferase subunit A
MTTTSRDLAYLPLAEVANLIRQKQLSPVELTQTILDRISELNPKVHAFYTVFSEQVLADAKQAEEEVGRGNYRGPLHGVPFAVKDIYEAGPTTGGSKQRKDYVAAKDCTAVAKLKEAGGLLLGKLATYEFAFSVQTLSSYFPPARNPWNLDFDPGGSSTGSGASVAAGLAYGAMGTCTGGSIRWPAFCCGIVGLKPTYGRVSRQGVFPLSWNLDHTGPLTRTVRDAALMLQGCAGYDPLDPASANEPVPDFSEKIGRDIRGIRIGIPRRYFSDTCDPEILASFQEAVKQMETLGATVVDVDSVSWNELEAAFWPIIMADAAAIQLDDMRKAPNDYNRQLKLLHACGYLISSTAYLQCQRLRQQIRTRMLRQLRDIDLFMLPTVGLQTPPILEQSPGVYFEDGATFYTAIFNMTGFPAIAIPSGFASNGLPVGFQLAGRPFEEATVFQVAHACEQSTPWHDKHPPL